MYMTLQRSANYYIKVFFPHLSPLKTHLCPVRGDFTPVRMHVMCMCIKQKVQHILSTFFIMCPVLSQFPQVRYYFYQGKK